MDVPGLRATPNILTGNPVGPVKARAVEAMRAGLAVVVSDGVGNPELVGDAGVVVPAGDAEALEAALVRLAGDEGERRRLGAAARARYERDFTLERFQQRMAALYGELLGVRLEGP